MYLKLVLIRYNIDMKLIVWSLYFQFLELQVCDDIQDHWGKQRLSLKQEKKGEQSPDFLLEFSKAGWIYCLGL